LVIRFIDHLQIVTTSNYSAVLIRTLCSSLQHVLRLLSLLCLHQSLSGNGFQRRTFPLLLVPELSPCLSYQQRLTTTELQRSSYTHTQSPSSSLHCTALLELEVRVKVTLLLAVYRPLVRLGAKPLEVENQSQVKSSQVKSHCD
jgi:hypothetical protein